MDLPDHKAPDVQEFKQVMNRAGTCIMSNVFNYNIKQAQEDEKFQESVTLLLQDILIPQERLPSLNSKRNRKELINMLTHSRSNFNELVAPLLIGSTLDGLPPNSMGYAAAKDYAAKFLTIVDKLCASEHKVPVTDAERFDLECVLINWLEWFKIGTCASTKKQSYIDQIMTIAIPIAYKLQCQHYGDHRFQKALQGYCFMLEELLDRPVTYKDVVEMYAKNLEAAEQAYQMRGTAL